MTFRQTIAALAGAFLLFSLVPRGAAAGELEVPEYPVVVTVAGNIQNTNRGPFDPEKDLFFKYHELTFDKAAGFDIAMLEALGLQQAKIKIPEWPAPVLVEGPRLKDLMTAVGAAGKTITLVALDGYASEISWDDLQKHDWIIGIRADGKPLGLGRRGPLWVVYGSPDGRPLTADDEARWPWATFYIDVE